jgi:N-terminal glutamine amidase
VPGDRLRHAPYFCEENAWHLVHDATVLIGGVPLTALERVAVFITNQARTVPTFAQRAGDPVVWDYHVVVFAHAAHGWRALDLDTTLGWDLPVATWLTGSFDSVPMHEHLRPHFRVVDSATLDATFASDRSHMSGADGAPVRPFPPWPPITCALGPMTLPRYLDLADPIAGSWLSLDEVRRRYGAPG